MQFTQIKPFEALNKAYRKQSLTEDQINLFKNNLHTLFNDCDNAEKKKESEEHFKNIVSEFLKETYFKGSNFINTEKRKDLVIHNDKTSTSNVGVIIEVKRPSNKAEMLTKEKANAKALHELLHYYLQERYLNDNKEVKHLIITNIYEWYIFDGADFERFFFDNPTLKKQYKEWNDGVFGVNKTDWFYQEVAKPFIEKELQELSCTYFNLKEIEEATKKTDNIDDHKLIDFYKILSAEHLLKKPFENDSNSLNKDFYNELLHILGLEETKDTSKRLIVRKAEGQRNEGSLLENTLNLLKIRNRLSAFENPVEFGETEDEQMFSLGLELCITWLNRILFLKLLEGQLIKYHKGDKAYTFLNYDKIKDFDELNELFFEVLAVPIPQRTKSVGEKYGNLPYLNSSLFEESEIERNAFVIAQLKDRLEMPVFGQTVLKEKNNEAKKVVGQKKTLQYLFEFLDAYNFESDSTAKIQKQNKNVINAAVLGLIFEKINGYKEGSFFTPSFITMYMCRETIRRAVIAKFNKKYQWDCQTFEALYNKIDSINIKEANEVVNSLKICDPAVGSGHFLVSALNEIIAIKSELRILIHKDGKRLRDYSVEVLDDELNLIDTEGLEDFRYFAPSQKRTSTIYYQFGGGSITTNTPKGYRQRIQETLFHEKQTIIENCLFGVDINPKSVMICRLRLWIELLKNMYYTEHSNYTELETLPNIDINIKTGNSLVYRFDIKDNNSKLVNGALQKMKLATQKYKDQVILYKSTNDKIVKKNASTAILELKQTFSQMANPTDKDYKVWKIAEAKMGEMPMLFSREEQEAWKHKLEILAAEVATYKQKYEHKLKTLYANAFEWRFEFPEVLDENGQFEGFDAIIGNPPYIKEYENRNAFNGTRERACYQGKMDIWYLFGDLGLSLLQQNGYLAFIATNNWLTNAGAANFRNIILKNSQVISLIDFGAYMVFDNAAIQTMVMIFQNNNETDNYTFDYRRLEGDKLVMQDVLALLAGTETEKSNLLSPSIIKVNLIDKPLTFNTDEHLDLLDKIKTKHNFFLREKADKKFNIKSELGQGIVAPQDFVNKASAEILKGKVSNGAGVFVLSQSEFENKKFLKKEKEIIKPYFTTQQMQKYYGNSQNTHWIIYTKSDINKFDKKTKRIPLDNYPNIKQHLDTFKSIITSDFAPYGLHRAREQYFFEGEKIMVTRKCPKEPIFTYTDFDCFVSQTFFVIQSDRINLKYLTGLLNSKLIAFWLRKKGKMQGNNYQLDKEPLLEIPIFKPSEDKIKKIADYVDKIIALKAQSKDSSTQEKKIDEWVYALYDITSDEQKIIEGT